MRRYDIIDGLWQCMWYQLIGMCGAAHLAQRPKGRAWGRLGHCLTLRRCAGKWADAAPKEVEEMKAKGVPFCYRCPLGPEGLINLWTAASQRLV